MGKKVIITFNDDGEIENIRYGYETIQSNEKEKTIVDFINEKNNEDNKLVSKIIFDILRDGVDVNYVHLSIDNGLKVVYNQNCEVKINNNSMREFDHWFTVLLDEENETYLPFNCSDFKFIRISNDDGIELLKLKIRDVMIYLEGFKENISDKISNKIKSFILFRQRRS
jgi:hypothetical protein